MPRRSNRIVFMVLTLTALSLYWGCTQPEDVVSDVTTTRLTLVPERLPTLPDSMDYELWVTDGSENISLGKFKYDQVSRTFDKADGTADNVFEFPGDLLKHSMDGFDKVFDYTMIFVSVEAKDDNDNVPGPIMLRDAVTDPEDEAIHMVFQNADSTIADATVRYNMESVSDRQRNIGDGSGVWFSTYVFDTLELPDTLHFDVSFESDSLGDLEIDSIFNNAGEFVRLDTLNADEILIWTKSGVDSAWVETTEVFFGADTVYLGPRPLYHIGYRVLLDSVKDTIAPYVGYKLSYTNYDTVPNDILLDMFIQDEFALPNYGPDWKYKGWAVSSTARLLDGNPGTLLSNVISDRMTPPAWRYDLIGGMIIPGADGALITTGTFSEITQPDDGNPFVLDDSVVPLFPGEDFLDVAALSARYGPGLTAAIDLLPGSVSNLGTVFITLEPSNFTDSTTNFPLFAFLAPMPPSRFWVSGSFVQENMRNGVTTTSGDTQGFPQITVEVETF